MPNKIHADYSSGNALYAVIRDRDGLVWCPAEQAFEVWGEGGNDAADYALALADTGGSHYVGDLDLDIPGGSYSIQVFRQIGAEPADTDTLIDCREMLWTGSGELTATKLLANRALQDKATGRIDFYDDNGQTLLLTLAPWDTQGFVARLPG